MWRSASRSLVATVIWGDVSRAGPSGLLEWECLGSSKFHGWRVHASLADREASRSIPGGGGGILGLSKRRLSANIFDWYHISTLMHRFFKMYLQSKFKHSCYPPKNNIYRANWTICRNNWLQQPLKQSNFRWQPFKKVKFEIHNNCPSLKILRA